MITFPNAKINLGLNIVERRPDGYHNIETVFYPIPLCDALEILPVGEGEELQFINAGLRVDGAMEHNLIIKAFRLLEKEVTLPPVHIYLYKKIPFGAGLGGGSSDAAFALTLLNKMFDLNLPGQKLEELVACLGADCPFFINNKPVFASGIGNVFEEVALSLKGYFLVLVKPDIFVSTPDAYASVIPKVPEYSLKDIIRLPVQEWKSCLFNDFEDSVFRKYPEIRKIKDRLYDSGALYSAMSGSGSSVFGIFPEIPDSLDSLFSGCFFWSGSLN
ncbi:MAG: 4-(cytidine 5'-diphospho)-2-C-methyl-D-erythritol kinase [Candidatus Azobacteroides sp.]|nr:4-(cytidine 5'-diphospho)-2-C-methyl-D-erythritol kinase [Candidatus Azobacteroides sp.]